jgi:hypothetical protein
MSLSRIGFTALFAAGAFVVPRAAGQTPSASLFPAPFVVEHRVRERQADGSVFESETVRSTYAYSWLVSERPDKSRVIVDFSRGEITEVRPSAGTYWVLSFGQMTDMKARLARAEQRTPAPRPKSALATSPVEIKVDEVAEETGSRRRAAVGESTAGATKRLRASAGDRVVDVWVDPSVRLSAAAQDALDSFTRAISGPSAAATPASAELIGAARRKAGGAFVVRSVRTSGGGGEIEEIVEKLAPAASVPRALLVPEEGLRRVPSPLEVVVSFAEEEAARRAPALPR